MRGKESDVGQTGFSLAGAAAGATAAAAASPAALVPTMILDTHSVTRQATAAAAAPADTCVRERASCLLVDYLQVTRRFAACLPPMRECVCGKKSRCSCETRQANLEGEGEREGKGKRHRNNSSNGHGSCKPFPY